MFDAGTNGAELRTEGFDHAVTTTTTTPTTRMSTTRDRELHARLVAIRRARVALEAEELRCLLEVEATELYRRRGYGSIREYMERELHYGPHAANERLRVARELQRLPRLAGAFDRGELPFSIVREVTRVATPHTEDAWLETARGKTAREVERRIAGLRPGDDPDARPDPDRIRERLVIAELRASTVALYRQLRHELDDEYGARHEERLDDDLALETILRLARQALHGAVAGAAAAAAPGAAAAPMAAIGTDAGSPNKKPTPTRPATHHAIVTCKVCRESFVSQAGIDVPLAASTAERLRCDAIELGDLDTDDRSRPTPTIPAAIRRKIWHRDAGRCVVPGCRSRAHLDVHHLRFRSHGGSHTVANGCLLCAAHHQHLHDGRLRIMGRAPALTVEWLREDREGSPIWVDDAQDPPSSHLGSGARGAAGRRRLPPSRPEAASRAG